MAVKIACAQHQHFEALIVRWVVGVKVSLSNVGWPGITALVNKEIHLIP